MIPRTRHPITTRHTAPTALAISLSGIQDDTTNYEFVRSFWAMLKMVMFMQAAKPAEIFRPNFAF